MKTPRAFVRSFAVIVTFILLVAGVSAEAELRIEKAFCGAQGSWRDVTAFLQRKVKDDTLSVKISQPFREIGGDPAPLHGKKLIIDYQLNGESFRLLLDEKYPVAFMVELPSSDAGTPGSDPLASAMMSDAKSHIRGAHYWLSYLGYCIILTLIIWAVVASVQLHKLKRQSGANT